MTRDRAGSTDGDGCSSRERRGATVVEVALVLPILFTVAFASIEFSRLLMVANSAEIAVLEAARRGVLPGATEADVNAGAAAELDAVLLRSYTTTCSFTTSNGTNQVVVEVDVPAVQENMWIPPVFTDGVTIHREVSLTREGG